MVLRPPLPHPRRPRLPPAPLSSPVAPAPPVPALGHHVLCTGLLSESRAVPDAGPGLRKMPEGGKESLRDPKGGGWAGASGPDPTALELSWRPGIPCSDPVVPARHADPVVLGLESSRPQSCPSAGPGSPGFAMAPLSPRMPPLNCSPDPCTPGPGHLVSGLCPPQTRRCPRVGLFLFPPNVPHGPRPPCGGTSDGGGPCGKAFRGSSCGQDGHSPGLL